MLNIQLVGDTELIARLSAMPIRMREALLVKVTALTLMLERRVKQKLSGEVLHVRTGALRSGIFHEVTSDALSVQGKVAAPKDVPYAAIHEFGGQTKPHDIYPKNAEALRFMMGGKVVFAKVVHHPGSKIPERSYMRSSLEELKTTIIQGLSDATRQALRTR